MLDTTEEILQKQREIYFKKTASERSMLGAELINFGRTIVESSIRQDNPEISPLDLKIAVFKRYYGNTFSKEETESIIISMTEYFRLKKSNS